MRGRVDEPGGVQGERVAKGAGRAEGDPGRLFPIVDGHERGNQEAGQECEREIESFEILPLYLFKKS